MNFNYVPPKFGESAFNCPHCGAYAQQSWEDSVRMSSGWLVKDLSVAVCARCGKYSLWIKKEMVYPNQSIAPLPSNDMPESVLKIYNEAKNIYSLSPTACAALLRLAIQRLCIELGEKGENLNEDIANLVGKGLPQKLQQALDTVRVIGNNAVHPGEINLDDNPEIALSLFNLVNIIVENMITQSKEVDELYNFLPENSKKAIEERDKGKENKNFK